MGRADQIFKGLGCGLIGAGLLALPILFISGLLTPHDTFVGVILFITLSFPICALAAGACFIANSELFPPKESDEPPTPTPMLTLPPPPPQPRRRTSRNIRFAKDLAQIHYY